MSKIEDFFQRYIRTETVRSITWVFAVFAVGFGLTLALTGESLGVVPSLRYTLSIAPPHIWGTIFILSGLYLSFRLVTKSKWYEERHGKKGEAAFACYTLGLLTCIWGALTIPSFLGDGASTLAAWIYLTSSVVLIICGTAIDADKKD